MRKVQLPETSIIAFEELTAEKMNRDYILIILALRKLKKANYEQIASFWKLSDKNIISRRLKEMVEMGLIFKPGTKSLSKSGKSCFDYMLCDGNEEAIKSMGLPEKVMEGKSVGEYAKSILEAANEMSSKQGNLFD